MWECLGVPRESFVLISFYGGILVISWFLKKLYMSLFGRFPIWAPTRFPEVIHLRYGPRNFYFKLTKCPLNKSPFSKEIGTGWEEILNTAGIYLLKVSNRSTRARCEICSKLTIKIPERRYMQLPAGKALLTSSLCLTCISSLWHQQLRKQIPLTRLKIYNENCNYWACTAEGTITMAIETNKVSYYGHTIWEQKELPEAHIWCWKKTNKDNKYLVKY